MGESLTEIILYANILFIYSRIMEEQRNMGGSGLPQIWQPNCRVLGEKTPRNRYNHPKILFKNRF